MSLAPEAAGWIAAQAPSSAARTASAPAAEEERRGIDDQRVEMVGRGDRGGISGRGEMPELGGRGEMAGLGGRGEMTNLRGGAQGPRAGGDGVAERPAAHHADPDALEDALPQDLRHARRSSRRCCTTPRRPTASSCA
jgi:hypothetical protein